jgi:hypothetical protein
VQQGGDAEPPASYDFLLDCRLDGFIDGVEVSSLDVQPTLEMLSAFPLQIDVDDDVFLYLAAERWGMAWNRWFVLTSGGESPMFLLEAMNADRLHPQAGDTSPLIDEIGVLLGDDGWWSPADYGSADGVCPFEDGCGAEPLVVEAQTNEETAMLEAGDSAMLSVSGDQPDVLVSVTAARAYPGDVCDDVPLAYYDIGTVAVQP